MLASSRADFEKVGHIFILALIQGTCFREHSGTLFAFCFEKVYEAKTASVLKLRDLDPNLRNLIDRLHYFDFFSIFKCASSFVLEKVQSNL